MDLHIHSTFSDGLFTPEELVDKVVAKGLDAFALTDHDTFDGIEVVSAILEKKKLNIIFLAGCEFSSFHPEVGEIHILGYFKHNDIKKLTHFTEEFRLYRMERAKKILECLKKNGFPLNEEEILKKNFVGRLNIARELVSNGFFNDVTEAFSKMLKAGAPCYVKKKEILPEEIIKKVTENGGMAILAHPTFLSGNKQNWEYIDRWKNFGLKGIECFHPKIEFNLANELIDRYKDNFFLTGGSDFHGDDESIEVGQFGMSKENFLEFYEFFSDKKI